MRLPAVRFRNVTPDVLEQELERLPDDLALLAADLGSQLRTAELTSVLDGVTDVTVVGSGDSLHAGLATQLAFHGIGRVTARALSVHAFPTYAGEWLAPPAGRRLVIVVSASGATPGALAAASQAREHGVRVLCLVGDQSSALASEGHPVLVYGLPDRVRSPGIRTYQAALAGLLMLAVTLRSSSDPAALSALQADFDAAATAMRAQHPRLREALADAGGGMFTGPLIFLGAGPQLGSAKHAAAKVVEAAGALAMGQELEEWWHVERLADPADMTTLLLVTPRSAPRAAEIAAAALQRGRQVLLAAPEGALWIPDARSLPVPPLREELSPLAFQGLGVLVAAAAARHLGRNPFEGGVSPAGG